MMTLLLLLPAFSAAALFSTSARSDTSDFLDRTFFGATFEMEFPDSVMEEDTGAAVLS